MKTNTCAKCLYEWVSRKEHPKECPRCKSRYWNKAKAIASLFLLAFLGSACQNCRTIAPTANLKIYILAGQSLMVGNWNTDQKDPIDKNLLMFKNGTWQPAQEPVSEDPNAHYGPGTAFGHELLKLNPNQQIGLVSCAVGSTDIDEWQPSNNCNLSYCNLAQKCVQEAQSAIAQYPGSAVVGILFNQGQSDMHEGITYWSLGFGHVTDYWHQTFGSIPVVFAQLGQFSDPIRTPTEIDQFRQDQASLKKDHTYMIKTDDLQTVDGVHATTPSQMEIGKRFAQVINSTNGIKECSEPWWSRIVRP